MLTDLLDPTRLLSNARPRGAYTRTSQLCWFECQELEADLATHFGRPRGPAEERTGDVLGGWFDGTMLARWWCVEFDNLLEELETNDGPI